MFSTLLQITDTKNYAVRICFFNMLYYNMEYFDKIIDKKEKNIEFDVYLWSAFEQKIHLMY